MTDAAQDFIMCPSCGRKGRYRPEFAGHRIKCPCGQMMDVTAPEPQTPTDDGLYALADDGPAMQPPRKAAASSESLSPAPTTPMPSPFARRERPKVEEDHRARNILIVAVPLLAILIIGAITLFRHLNGGAQTATGPTKGEDADVQRMIDDEGGKDIEAWLAENPNRIVSGMLPSQGLARAAMLKKMGAKRVLAFGAAMTRTLAVELPDDVDQRKQLFAWQAQWHKSMQVKVWADEGQHWLLLRLGL